MKGLLLIALCSMVGTVFGAYSTTCPQHGTLKQVLDRYAELLGQQVEMVEGLPSIGSAIDLKDKSLTANEIKSQLAEVNIGLFPISGNRMVASLIQSDPTTAREYWERYKKTQIVVPIFGWKESRTYIDTVPELKILRENFETADQALGDILDQDEEYAEARVTYKEEMKTDRAAALNHMNKAKSAVFKQLNAESATYQEARKNRDKALYRSNIATFEYMIEDYEKQGKTIPTDWLKPKRSTPLTNTKPQRFGAR